MASVTTAEVLEAIRQQRSQQLTEAHSLDLWCDLINNKLDDVYVELCRDGAHANPKTLVELLQLATMTVACIEQHGIQGG